MEILIVDDAPDVRAWLTAVLEAAGWNVFQASDGAEAQRVLETTCIRVVITDWMMPGLDGMGLIGWIRQRQTRDYVYIILMTSRDQESDYVDGLSGGADDFLTKPTSPPVLKARLEVARRILSIQQRLLEQQEQLRRSRELTRKSLAIVNEDLEGASLAQRSLLPGDSRISEHIESAWLYQPAMGVSGDYLDIFSVGPDRLAFCLLDVSGHGIAAALRSAAISQMLRPISGLLSGLDAHGPAHVITQLNRHLCQGNEEVEFIATLIFGIFDAASGTVRFASAGHPPPLVTRRESGTRPIIGGGIPLGISPDACYSDSEFVLKHGDSMLLYSDGLPECENTRGEKWGLEALHLATNDAAGQPPDRLLDHLDSRLAEWRGEAEISDDLSALALRYRGAV